jgi:hypothetical protein
VIICMKKVLCERCRPALRPTAGAALYVLSDRRRDSARLCNERCVFDPGQRRDDWYSL